MRPVSEEGLRACVEKMHAAGVPEVAIATFSHYYRQLDAGVTGLISEREIEPVEELPSADNLSSGDEAGADVLDRAVVVKLNGGLGTSMGMTQTKALLEGKEGPTFFDIISRPTPQLRRR